MTAYEGNEPFVFISYAHKDKNLVLPIIQGLQDRGFRVWYDEGVELGNEWPDFIAEHLEQCRCVLSFVSRNFGESQNCRQEFTFAQNLHKENSVVYLEDPNWLRAGLRMQLGNLHALYLEHYHDIVLLLNELSDAAVLKPCLDPSKRLELDAEKIYKQAESQFNRNRHGLAVRQYYRAATLGYAPAQYRLGRCYDRGEGVPKAYEEATKWYHMAAEQGNTDAQYDLGVCYELGVGMSYDFEEAAKWYRMAAEQGDMDAQYSLGFCYDSGQGVSQNLEDAAKWYRMAAEQGHISAQYFLGMLYEEGEGVQQNKEEARKWYQMAADQGDEEAADRLKTLK